MIRSSARRWLFVLGVVLAQGLPACSGGPEGSLLNPQPLPPRAPEDNGDFGGSGGSAAPAKEAADAGTADGGDGGPEGGDR